MNLYHAVACRQGPFWPVTSIPGLKRMGRYRRVTGPPASPEKASAREAQYNIAGRRRFTHWSAWRAAAS
jgi:hypothetical protein